MRFGHGSSVDGDQKKMWCFFSDSPQTSDVVTFTKSHLPDIPPETSRPTQGHQRIPWFLLRGFCAQAAKKFSFSDPQQTSYMVTKYGDQRWYCADTRSETLGHIQGHKIIYSLQGFRARAAVYVGREADPLNASSIYKKTIVCLKLQGSH